MKILMLTWEFPPLISGGLGMACYGMVSSLLNMGVEVELILPAKHSAYFTLVQKNDIDTLPVTFFNSIVKQEYESLVSTSVDVVEKLKFIGISEKPETYLNLTELQGYSEFFEQVIRKKQQTRVTKECVTEVIHDIKPPADSSTLNSINQCLEGDEDIFRKVREYTLRATEMAQTLDFDLIHSHDWLTYPAAMFIKKLTGKPLVTHIHATEFDRAGGEGDQRIHNIEFAGMSAADIVIAVSKYTAQMVMNRYRIDSAKLRIIHNAHSTRAIKETRAGRRLFKGPTILFLGRITIQKGPDYFLDVAKIVLSKHPDARFIMAGTGDMARKLLHKSAQYRLQNRFLFAGFLNREEVETILSNSDIYMLPSVSEPFGIAPLEAMAYGITAVISKQSGVAEVVENAFKIDFWDVDKMAKTICYLIENPEICREIGQKGMLEVEKIRWDDAAGHILDVYKESLTEEGVDNA